MASKLDCAITEEMTESTPLLSSEVKGGDAGVDNAGGCQSEVSNSRVYTPVSYAFTDQNHRRWSSRQLPHKDYDSLDYDISYNMPYKTVLNSYTTKTYIVMEVVRWVLVCIIGLLTGLVAFIIDVCVKELFKLKYATFEKVLDGYIDSGYVILAFLVLLGFNVGFALVAALFIAWKPAAAGSGIPEVKCYLNGVKVPHVARLSTFVAKTVGVLFTVVGGFLAGKEGPMIHIGAIIGAGIPQLRFKNLSIPYPYFRNDRDKRDFVSSGAAIGVAAAFGAPIGGVLFSLERASSFWNQDLIWRTLFCCFSATFTLNFLITIYTAGLQDTFGKNFGFLGSPGLVNFGVFSKDENRLWNVYHLIIFVLIGATGGLLGALFNSLNINVTKYRMKYIARRRSNWLWKVLEVVLISMVTTSTVFLVAMTLGSCMLDKIMPVSNCTAASGDISFVNETRDFFCPGHTATGITTSYFNDMATLLFNSQEVAIKQLFHQDGAFTLATLLIVFIVYFFIACWTYGSSIPSGLFVPCLMIGAVYGRFLSTLFYYLRDWQPYYFNWLTTLYPGTYALIGAASFIGGVVRLTLSLTVILIELTNEIEYGLPIMITVMVARWVGDIFNQGIYDSHIALKKAPFLERASPRRLDKLIAEDVMCSSGEKLNYLYPITRVRSLERLLRTTCHSAFLIVTPVKTCTVPEFPKIHKPQHTPQLYTHVCDSSTIPSEDIVKPSKEEEVNYRKTYSVPIDRRAIFIPPDTKLVFRGLILRHELVILLKNKAWFDEGEGPASQPKVSHAQMTLPYPHYPDIYSSVFLNETERNLLMDLSVYMNPNPYTISREAPLPQVFNLFRTMGLRHLPVIEEGGIVVGIITRHDLTHEKLHEIRYRKKRLMLERQKMRSHTSQPCEERVHSVNNGDQSTSMVT